MKQRNSKKTVRRVSTGKDSLVGQFFLSPSEEKGWQGQVIGKVGEYYRVQLFEWAMGFPTDQRLMALEEMHSWSFYQSEDEWHEAAEKRCVADRELACEWQSRFINSDDGDESAGAAE